MVVFLYKHFSRLRRGDFRYTKIFFNTFFPQSFRSRVPKGFRRCTSTTREKGWTVDSQIRPGDDLRKRKERKRKEKRIVPKQWSERTLPEHWGHSAVKIFVFFSFY